MQHQIQCVSAVEDCADDDVVVIGECKRDNDLTMICLLGANRLIHTVSQKQVGKRDHDNQLA
jgi:hypothetical protein